MAKNNKYTPEFVQKILDYYVIFGVYNTVAEKLEINKSQVYRVVNRNLARVATLKKEREPMLERMFTEIIELCTSKELELINTSKDLRAITWVKAVNYDKRSLARGEPTERISVESEGELDTRLVKRMSGREAVTEAVKVESN